MIMLGCLYACWQCLGNVWNQLSVMSSHSVTRCSSSSEMSLRTVSTLGMSACLLMAQCMVGSSGGGDWLFWWCSLTQCKCLAQSICRMSWCSGAWGGGPQGTAELFQRHTIFWMFVCCTPGGMVAPWATVRSRKSIHIAVGMCHVLPSMVFLDREAHQAFTLDWCDGLPWPIAVSRKVLRLVLPRGELASMFFPSLPGPFIDLCGLWWWSALFGWCLCGRDVRLAKVLASPIPIHVNCGCRRAAMGLCRCQVV